jgi:hypothetical protein
VWDAIAGLFTGIDARCLVLILVLTIVATVLILKYLVLPQMRSLASERDYWRSIGVPAVQGLKATTVALETQNGGA